MDTIKLVLDILAPQKGEGAWLAPVSTLNGTWKNMVPVQFESLGWFSEEIQYTPESLIDSNGCSNTKKRAFRKGYDLLTKLLCNKVWVIKVSKSRTSLSHVQTCNNILSIFTKHSHIDVFIYRSHEYPVNSNDAPNICTFITSYFLAQNIVHTKKDSSGADLIWKHFFFYFKQYTHTA